jgi:MTH538 TIR-like domain (DUF1863)
MRFRMPNSANVFISHIHEDDEYLARMKKLLAKRGFALRDSSINETRPNRARDENYIKKEILAPRIRWAGSVVVLISPDTKDSKYVAWEIEYANQQGKRIVGVYTPGSADCDVPDGLEDYADSIVAWDGDALLTAVRGDEVWQDSNGSSRASKDIARHGC